MRWAALGGGPYPLLAIWDHGGPPVPQDMMDSTRDLSGPRCEGLRAKARETAGGPAGARPPFRHLKINSAKQLTLASNPRHTDLAHVFFALAGLATRSACICAVLMGTTSQQKFIQAVPLCGRKGKGGWTPNTQQLTQ